MFPEAYDLKQNKLIKDFFKKFMKRESKTFILAQKLLRLTFNFFYIIYICMIFYKTPNIYKFRIFATK